MDSQLLAQKTHYWRAQNYRPISPYISRPRLRTRHEVSEYASHFVDRIHPQSGSRGPCDHICCDRSCEVCVFARVSVCFTTKSGHFVLAIVRTADSENFANSGSSVMYNKPISITIWTRAATDALRIEQFDSAVASVCCV